MSTSIVNGFTRQDVARILGVSLKQMAKWQRDGLLQERELYSFADVAHVRSLRELQKSRVPMRRIRESVAAMRKVAGMEHPLQETRAERFGARVVFRHSGALLDPQTHQLAFDFGRETAQGLALVTAPEKAEYSQQAQELFLQAVQMEENVETLGQAEELYLRALALHPKHAAASINLGTIYYNQHRYEEAEARYRYATEVDPEYALAFFDLGNVLDELQRMPEAIEAYLRAIAILPEYADAHYNLALAYERCGQKRKALRFWLSYVKMDPVGPWAAHAKSQAKRILASEKLQLVCRRGQRVSATRC